MEALLLLEKRQRNRMRMARNRRVQELHERRGNALGIAQESKRKRKKN